MITLAEFIEEASYCFVKKSSLLISMYKTGYPDTAKITNDIKVLGMYFFVLRRLGNDYALTSTEAQDIMSHLLKICGRTNLQLPDALDVIGGTPIGGGTGTGGGTPIPVEIYTMNYSGVETFSVTVNHNLGKYSPMVIVTDTSGASRVRVYPSITENTVNQLILEFNSTSSGVITVI